VLISAAFGIEARPLELNRVFAVALLLAGAYLIIR
jgi:hypothetical protein